MDFAVLGWKERAYATHYTFWRSKAVDFLYVFPLGGIYLSVGVTRHPESSGPPQRRYDAGSCIRCWHRSISGRHEPFHRRRRGQPLFPELCWPQCLRPYQCSRKVPPGGNDANILCMRLRNTSVEVARENLEKVNSLDHQKV